MATGILCSRRIDVPLELALRNYHVLRCCFAESGVSPLFSICTGPSAVYLNAPKTLHMTFIPNSFYMD